VEMSKKIIIYHSFLNFNILYFLNYVVGNPERKKIIDLLRRKGNFIYNTNLNLNKGDLIVCRRPRKNLDRQAADFIPCAKCKGFFSKNNIRHHFALCAQEILREM